MKNTRIVFWVACCSLLLLSACGSNVMLDNNRNGESVTFVFDGNDEYALNPGEKKEISLSEGSHKLSVKSDKSGAVADTSIQVKEGGLVHAGGCNYIVWRQLYGLQTDRKSLLNEDWTMIDSTRFLGDFKIHPHNVLYIEKNWTLGLNEEMPDAQTLYITKDYKVESKVFQEMDFVKIYREMAEKNKKPE